MTSRIKKFSMSFVATTVATFVFAVPVHAQIDDLANVEITLRIILESRPDLQEAFPNGRGNARMVAAGMKTIEDWARRYGHKEFPELLGGYAKAVSAPVTPKSLVERRAAASPTKIDNASFDFSRISARAVLVIDAATRRVLLSHRADEVWPIASITKLMTTSVVLDKNVSLAKKVTMAAEDEVGGATLSVKRGTPLGVRDLMYATLVGSANNAATALSRSTGLSRAAFVAAMNQRAKALGLSATKFADPSGINPANVSTPREVAALSFEAFALPEVQRATTTAKYPIMVAKRQHVMTNTNKLLTDEKNGLIVMGGKTGYLEESMWNLTVLMRTASQPALLTVVFGSASKNDSFRDAELAARWVWAHHRWTR